MTSYPSCALLLLILVTLHCSFGIDLPENNGSTFPVPGVMNLALNVHVPETTTTRMTSEYIQSAQATDSPRVNIIDQGSVSREQYETIKLVVDVILKPAVCFVGLVLNVIGIVVLLQPQLRHGFYIYLATLSIADSGYLLCGLIRASVKIYGYFNDIAAARIEGTIIPYIDRCIEIPFCKVGAYCIILFSLDRLLAVICPLKVKDFFLSRHTKIISLSVAVFIFICYLPKGIDFETVTVFNSNVNMSFTALRPAKHEEGSTMSTLVFSYNLTVDIIFTYLPPVLICIINLLIIIQIQRIRKSRKQLFGQSPKLNKSYTDHQKLIATVFTISAFFLAVYIPMILVRIFRENNPDFRRYKKEHYLTMIIPTFTSFGWSINAAIDFTVYLATSERFRQTLRATCCQKRWKKGTLIISPVGSRSWTIINSTSSSSMCKSVDDASSENGSNKLERKMNKDISTSGIYILSESSA